MVLSSPLNTAKAFNKYFLNIKDSLNIHTAKDKNPTSLLKKYYPYEFPPMQIDPITEGYIKSIISFLKSKNSFGYDGISTKILKLCGNKRSNPLTFIYNKSITVGVILE
jgi:hypothetical protein